MMFLLGVAATIVFQLLMAHIAYWVIFGCWPWSR